MGGKIDGYVDCVSPYSFFAFEYLRKHRDVLASHGVEVEWHPVFLGAIMTKSGNVPPWKLPARAKQVYIDTKRAEKYFGLKCSIPTTFPVSTILPLRCLIYIKSHHPTSKYEAQFQTFWRLMFQQNTDISSRDATLKALRLHFSETEANKILQAADAEPQKQGLTANTNKALDLGAYGAPFFWVTPGAKEGEKVKGEPFFGSDRFHYMWEFLGLPYTEMELQGKAKL